MVGIYSYYLWQNKPIIIKGSPNRFRNFVYIDDCINVLFKSISNKHLNNLETINLTSGNKVTVKKLIKTIKKHMDNKKIKKHFFNIKFDVNNKKKDLMRYWTIKIKKKKYINNTTNINQKKKHIKINKLKKK